MPIKNLIRRAALPITLLGAGLLSYLALESDFARERFAKSIAQKRRVELIEPSNPLATIAGSSTGKRPDEETAQSSVSFRDDEMLLINGKPFFPIGTFFPIGARDNLEETAKSGFNAVHDYRFGYDNDPRFGKSGAPKDDRFPKRYFESFTEPFLDEAQRNKLKVLFELPRAEAIFGYSELLEERVNKFKDHPALLSWYLMDEPEWHAFTNEIPIAVMVQRIGGLYQKIKKIDKRTPVSLLLEPEVYSSANYYFDSIDIVITDPHLYEATPSQKPMLRIKTQLKSAERYFQKMRRKKPSWLKPRWVVVQAVDIELHNDAKKVGKEHSPNTKEIRCMAYLPICFGAKGLFFYFPAYHDSKDNWEMLGYSLPEDYPDIYQGLLSVVKELNELYPFLTKPDETAPLYVSSNQEVCIWSRSNGSEDRVIAVNPLEREVSTEICENKFRKLKEVREISGRNIQPQDNFFPDSFGPYEVRVYKITKE